MKWTRWHVQMEATQRCSLTYGRKVGVVMHTILNVCISFVILPDISYKGLKSK